MVERLNHHNLCSEVGRSEFSVIGIVCYASIWRSFMGDPLETSKECYVRLPRTAGRSGGHSSVPLMLRCTTDKQTQPIVEGRTIIHSRGDGALAVHGTFDMDADRDILNVPDSGSLRAWWHDILRMHRCYSCYAIFLLLPSDKEAVRYLTDFGRELDLISGENCLIIVLSEDESRRVGFDEALWRAAVTEQASGGYSISIARLFEIDFARFPCLILFEDIRSPRHAIVTLRGMTAEEIADRLRKAFSVIQEAVANGKNPVEAIESRRRSDSFQRRGQSIIGGLRSLGEKTFETAVETWIKAIFV